MMAFFVLNWVPAANIHLDRRAPELLVRDSGDAARIRAGDYIYVTKSSAQLSLIARLHVTDVAPKPHKNGFLLDISSPESTYFHENGGQSVPNDDFVLSRPSKHREAVSLPDGLANILENYCDQVDDFSVSQTVLPSNWRAIVGRLERATSLARRNGDNRPGVEVAFDYLRENYYTSQLPGPKPVYINAARRAFQMPLEYYCDQTTQQPRKIRDAMTSEWGQLTDAAIDKGINEDVATFLSNSPDSKRHQQILRSLRNRLVELGFSPQYNGFVDCKISTATEDIYFEVKSASPDTFVHQMRLGIGQLLHYIWKDHSSSVRPIQGFLIVEDVNITTDFRDFVTSVPFRTCLSSEISELVL